MRLVDSVPATINWDLLLQATSDDIVLEASRLLSAARSQFSALKKRSGPRTFDDLLLALDDLTYEYNIFLACLRHLESAECTETIRNAYQTIRPESEEFFKQIGTDDELWAALNEFSRSAEAASLTPVRRRFLSETLLNLSREGGFLHIEDAGELEDIGIELQQMTEEYSANVLDATNAYRLPISDASLLAGIPPSD